MGWYGFLILLAFPAYFCYAVFSALKAARQRREAAAAQFGTFAEHPQEEWERLHAVWELQQAENRPAVDDITWNDLDMDQVFHRLNSCQTTPGEELLYYRLRTLPGPEPGWEEAIGTLDKNPSLRQKIQALLLHAGKNAENGLPELMKEPDDYRLPFAGLLRIAAFLPIVALLLLFPPFPQGLGIVVLIPTLMLNAFLYYWGDRKLQGKLHTVRYAKALIYSARKLARLPMPGLEKEQAALKEAFAPFAKLRGAMPGAWQEGVSLGDPSGITALFHVFLLRDLQSYNRFMAVLTAKQAELKKLYGAIGRLDLLICTLSLRKSLPSACIPAFHPQMALQAQNALHPLLEKGVGNSASFSKGVLITGSNASGKSTFIKMLAINAILAQAINTCCADAFSLPRAHVLSSMALRDNITKGESYFVVEIKSFRRILQAAKTTPCLCFIDEILRGTNTVERIAASAAVLKSLQQSTSLCIAATHDIELAAMLAGQYDNYHFREEVRESLVHFDYTLRPGPSRTRNALLLLQAYDFPAPVVEEALEMVKTFEKEHRWPAPAALEGGDAPASAPIG